MFGSCFRTLAAIPVSEFDIFFFAFPLCLSPYPLTHHCVYHWQEQFGFKCIPVDGTTEGIDWFFTFTLVTGLKCHASSPVRPSWISDADGGKWHIMTWWIRHGGRLHKMVVRCVQQPVQDVSFVVSGLTDSLGQIKSGQELHYSGNGWVQGVVVMHVEVAKDDGGAMSVCLFLRLGGGR